MMQAWLLGNSKALLVLGLGTLEANIFRDDLVRHVAAGRYEVATRPQVPTPEQLAQLSSIHQEMVGGLALDRLHHTARSQVRRHVEQQMHMVRPDVAPQDLDIMRSTDLSNQIADVRGNVTAEHRLAILRAEHEVVVQLMNSMGGSAVPFHGSTTYRKPPEGVT